MNNEIQIPAASVILNGLKAEYHMLHHAEKLRRNPLDAGIDLFASAIEKVDEYQVTEPIEVAACCEIWVSTLVHMVVPPGTVGIVMERSSSIKTLGGGRVITGVIDATYTGEIKVRVMANALMRASVVARLEEAIKNRVAIAQMLVQPVLIIMPSIRQLPVGGRGTSGFGSTTGLINN